MKFSAYFLFAIVAILFTPVNSADASPTTQIISVDRLTCEYLVNPTGIDVVSPRLSWIDVARMPSDNQSGYRIIVSSSPALLAAHRGNLWDSGKVYSSNSTLITYGGRKLSSRLACWWAVQVWDSAGAKSSFSAPGSFTVGLLNKSDWRGEWIGKATGNTHLDLLLLNGADWIWYPDAGQPNISAPIGTRYFRLNITVNNRAALQQAKFVGTVDDNFTLYVNGKIAAESVTWDEAVGCDVKKYLHSGANELAIEARNIGDASNPAGVLGAVKLVYTDGSQSVSLSGANWKSSNSAGAGWTTTSFDDSSWPQSTVLGEYGMQPWGILSEGDPAPVGPAVHTMLPARYLRRQFTIHQKVVNATAYVCGLGFFQLSVNGKEATDHVMDPALSDYSKVDYYVTVDVTKLVKQGQNVIGVVLGNGRFYYPRASSGISTYNYGSPRLLMQVELTFADGSKETIASNRSWMVTDQGPIRDDNEYDGEIYDARMAMVGWDRPEYHVDKSLWAAADTMSAPGGTIKAQMIEPMRVMHTVRPAKVISYRLGTYIVDMGRTMYGTVRIRAAGRRGTTVKMSSAYALLPSGALKMADNRTALSTDSYTFAGTGMEMWNPIFKGQGYRRVQVTGFPGVPKVANFTGLDEHTGVRQVGTFTCSNPLVNKIHSAMVTGMTMFLRSAPLDPDRDERQAWMGDPAKDSESEAYNFDVAAFYTKWMDDVRRSQRLDGTIPDVAMYWTMGNGVEWPSVFTIIPDWYTGFYADTRLESSNYDAMKRWVLSMQRIHVQSDGTLEAAGYSDWCDTYTIGGKISEYGQTSRELISTAYQYNNVRILQHAAHRFGKLADEEMFRSLGDALYTAFLRRFYDPVTNTFTSGTQCSFVLPLAFGLLPDDQAKRQAIVDNLVNDILVTHDGHLTVGLLGNQWLLQVLTQYGRPDVAWEIVTQTTRPSWGYMIGQGSDTIWERWDYDTRDPGMNSQALLIQAGNTDAWFYQTLGGINYDPLKPGFSHILIHPYFPSGVTFVNCSFDSPHGLIVSNWVRHGVNAALEITIPTNTTATVTTPDGTVRQLKSGTWQLKSVIN